MTPHSRNCLDLRFWGREVGHFSAQSRRERGKEEGGHQDRQGGSGVQSAEKKQRVEEREAQVRGTSRSEICDGESGGSEPGQRVEPAERPSRRWACRVRGRRRTGRSVD